MDLRINFAIVDLPDPDSPANTKTSPFLRLNDMSSTAFIVTVFVLKMLFLIKNFLKFSILRISSNV